MKGNLIIQFLSILTILNHFICFKDEEMKKLFKVNIIKPGDDTNYPQIGNELVVHFTGWYADTMRKYESSYDTKEPKKFIIGKKFMIECWEKVMLKISLGEKIKFICPHSLAFGNEGIKGKIPPKTNLAFEVELLEIKEGMINEL